MLENKPSVKARFGPYTLDLSSGELHKHSTKLRLGEQPFQILSLLIERRGQVVNREEFHKQLWPSDTFVDFEHGLNSAIRRLRETLGDTQEEPRWVETIPRRGYRFIGGVEWQAEESGGKTGANGAPIEALPGPKYRFVGEIAPQAHSAVPAEPSHRKHTRPRWQAMAAGLLGILICTLAVGFAYRWSGPRQASAALSAFPFTALPGLEISPAFSPDGSRIAFAWNGDPASGGKGFDLYVKAIGSETLLRLTHHPSEWISPAWSPDGSQIAFHRMAGAETGLYVVPALGGPERKLRATRVPYAVAAPISWSPDDKWIGFGEPLPDKPEDRMFLLSVESLETQELPHDPKCLHEATPTFSNAGDRLAYLCVRSTNEFELYSLALPGGAPKLITAFSNFPIGFAWSADDRKLLLALSSDGGPDLHEIVVADGSSRRLDFAANASWPTVSLKGNKLAYSAISDNINIWRQDLLYPQAAAVKLLSSTREQDDAQYSPDGQHIAFGSNRAGSAEIWMSDADGNNLVQLSKFKGASGTPRWSPDSRKIVFDSHRSGHFAIYIVDISERAPRKLVINLRKDVSAPNWSRDGKWIYFRSYEVMGHKMYRCAAAGGDAVLLSTQPDEISPQESYDGDVLYFAARNVNTGLRMIPLRHSSTESAVDGIPPVASENLWSVVSGGIYFVPADTPRSLCYFDFSSRKIREVFHIEKNFGGGLSVSPDGRWLLYSQVDEENGDIMIVDHFS
jgi:Tol biopolymer transport system component/DNA-binding winged helix-turn-helix (wHTH) protein